MNEQSKAPDVDDSRPGDTVPPASKVVESAREHADKRPRLVPKFKPCFRIHCKGDDIEALPKTDVPGGHRMRVVYRGGKVEPLPSSVVAKLEGHVVSGGDWILIRDDGVAVFDGRLTLAREAAENSTTAEQRAKRDATHGVEGSVKNKFLLSMRLTGIVPPNAGGGFTGKRSVVLTATFEGAGPVQQWTKPLFQERSESYESFKILLQHPCAAVGEIVIDADKVTELKLDIFTMNPRGG